MMVPNGIRKVFDTFPLKEYPPVSNTTTAVNDALQENQFYFQLDSDSPMDASFILGVFNVAEIKGKYVPTDPLGLAYSFILCSKNDLRLPVFQNDNKPLRFHSMMKLSYSASPDKTLPILIEDDLQSKSREIKLLHHLQSQTGSALKTTDPDQYMINQLLDTELYDTWLLCIWFESAVVDLGQIFGLPLIEITKIHLFESLPSWNHFKIRYPTLVPEVYDSKLNDIKSILTWLDTTEGLSNIVLQKLYAFVIHIKYFLQETRLMALIPAGLMEKADQFFDGF